MQKRTGCKDRDLAAVASLPRNICLPYFKQRFFGGHDRRLFSRQSYVNGPWVRGGGERRFVRLFLVAWRDDYHVGLYAHERDVLERLMRRAIGADREARVAPDDFDA